MMGLEREHRSQRGVERAGHGQVVGVPRQPEKPQTRGLTHHDWDAAIESLGLGSVSR